MPAPCRSANVVTICAKPGDAPSPSLVPPEPPAGLDPHRDRGRDRGTGSTVGIGLDLRQHIGEARDTVHDVQTGTVQLASHQTVGAGENGLAGRSMNVAHEHRPRLLLDPPPGPVEIGERRTARRVIVGIRELPGELAIAATAVVLVVTCAQQAGIVVAGGAQLERFAYLGRVRERFAVDREIDGGPGDTGNKETVQRPSCTAGAKCRPGGAHEQVPAVLKTR